MTQPWEFPGRGSEWTVQERISYTISANFRAQQKRFEEEYKNLDEELKAEIEALAAEIKALPIPLGERGKNAC